MPTLRKSLAGAIDRRFSVAAHHGQRVRKRTPPKPRDHKPPLPPGPPPSHVVDASPPGSPGKVGAAGHSPLSRSASLGTTVMSGYLAKEGEIPNMFGRHTWKRRWFVLEKGELVYYTDQQACARGEKALKGHKVQVCEYTLMLDYDSADIALLPSSEDASGSTMAKHSDRVWKFVCDSREDVEKWTRAFMQHGASLSPLSAAAAAAALAGGK